MHVHCLLGLKHMSTYKRVMPATATTCRYLLRTENALFNLFCLRKRKNRHNVGTAVVPEKRFSFSPFYSFSYFFFSILNVNCFLDQFTPQFINIIATNNDLLTDELNVVYFAPKLWLYVMIWLPRTTDNSTYFAQSLEIRGFESRLYY